MAVAWLFADERTAAAHGVLELTVRVGAIVPSLWRLEVANVMRNAVRRGRCDEDFVDRSLTRLGRLLIAVDEGTDTNAWGVTRTISRDLGLTLYDAAYLELAIRAGTALATCDNELIHAARLRSVEVLVA